MKQETTGISQQRWLALVCGPVLAILAVLLGLQAANGLPVQDTSPRPEATTSGDAAYVYRFDPSTTSFQSIPIPGTNKSSNVDGVLAVSAGGPVNVYVADPGMDVIHRLTYTGTSDLTWTDYPLPSGSDPLNLTASGRKIWFTEYGRDQIASLDPQTGEIEEHDADPSFVGEGPVDIATDGFGDVWYSLFRANRVGQLDVASGEVVTYTSAFQQGVPESPYGLTVYTQNSVNFVWLAELFAGRGTKLQQTPGIPFNGQFVRVCVDPDHDCSQADSQPYRVVIVNRSDLTANTPWYLLRGVDGICSVNTGTNAACDRYHYLTTRNSGLADMAVEHGQNGQDTRLWLTAELAGQLAQFELPTGPFTMYNLPVPNQQPRGISLDATGMVWLASKPPRTLDLPVVGR